jgi:hypothetical protein
MTEGYGSAGFGGGWHWPPYHVRLLAEARGLIGGEEYQLAVVLAQVACELRAEQAFGACYERKAIGELAKPIRRLIPAYDLTNDRVRPLYEALTGDRLAAAPFWEELLAHAERRDDVVHRGRPVTRAEAEASVAVAERLIRHLDGVLAASPGPPPTP